MCQSDTVTSCIEISNESKAQGELNEEKCPNCLISNFYFPHEFVCSPICTVAPIESIDKTLTMHETSFFANA